MASLPPRQASQRRSSPREQGSSADATNLPRADSESFSTASVDSDTVLFDSAYNYPANGPSQTTEAKQAPAAGSQRPQHKEEEEEPRKCWICFNDETEDGPGSSAWRSPCPCALVAHEDCLLDWVASQEAPNARRQAGSGSKIKCPQCKSEIHLKRPTSKVVDGVRAIERLTGMLILPGTMGVLVYTCYQACFMHGVSTVYALFGLEDGYRILKPLHQAPAVLRDRAHNSVALAVATRFFQHARLHFGLSAIPPILVASRVSIADSVLPILPVVFLASSNAGDDVLNFGHWPPSAALSFSLLPYIRGAYNTYMEKVWGERQRQWLKEIQPRAGETDDDANDENRADAEPFQEDDGAIFELNLDLAEEDDDEEEEHFHDDFHDLPGMGQWPGDQQRAPPLGAPPLDDHAAGPQAHGQQQQQQGGGAAAAAAAQQQQPRPRPRPRAQHRERNLIFQTTNIADTVLGALVFPSIAAAVGELIRLGLPRSWVTPPAGGAGRATGFLQQRWARSLVGGCLFVAVKDAVLLYVRWRMAQNHRKRQVLDYDKKKGKVVER
ncbi:putative ring finger domain-containing protein [Neofusicoccum parvum UCRNP2]|uniref:Putative ring finger domain-containing protein n=1 Tax=Botryosphaeria parva (strain UCR-NP2) TaxID=1287680 RepID=R1EJY6_BOTPV|nr:putative ring finger domain-containing protein [Neofusicoccum parvum UCRNP2]